MYLSLLPQRMRASTVAPRLFVIVTVCEYGCRQINAFQVSYDLCVATPFQYHMMRCQD